MLRLAVAHDFQRRGDHRNLKRQPGEGGDAHRPRLVPPQPAHVDIGREDPDEQQDGGQRGEPASLSRHQQGAGGNLGDTRCVGVEARISRQLDGDDCVERFGARKCTVPTPSNIAAIRYAAVWASRWATGVVMDSLCSRQARERNSTSGFRRIFHRAVTLAAKRRDQTLSASVKRMTPRMLRPSSMSRYPSLTCSRRYSRVTMSSRLI